MYIPDADEKNMARRFTNVEEEDLSNLLDDKDSKNTKNTIQLAVNTMVAYCVSKNVIFFDFEKLSVDALSGDLRSFYASVRTPKGAYYSKKSMIGIRYVIHHPLNVRDLDIEKNDELKPANLLG